MILEGNDLLPTLVKRYAKCTAQDIAFLRSRVAGILPRQPKLNDKRFRNVSVITAWNAQKDRINDIGGKRFAADTGQTVCKVHCTRYCFPTFTSGRNTSSTTKVE